MNLGHFLFLFLIASVVAWLMVDAGMSKGALELKRVRRVCPSCGRTTRDCCCR